MSLGKIYELDEKANKYKEEADRAYKKYNGVLSDLENERQKFKKIVGITDSVKKDSLRNLIKEAFDGMYFHAAGFWTAIILIPLGFLLLMVNIVSSIVLICAGFIFLLVGCMCFWHWKRSEK